MGFPDEIYYEPNSLDYELGKYLKEKYKDKKWIEIENHNNIPQMRANSNDAFPQMKKHLIVGVRKTHRYVENHKVSDYLVPFTSSGCSAMCMYCYLVCNYNKCAYMRVFVNREQMMEKLIKYSNKAEKELCFEIGSNSDLILENEVTNNLPWIIEEFGSAKKGLITFPTKFDMVDPLLHLNHKEKVIFRMSLNPQEIITKVEFGTSSLLNRIEALNKMCEAGYKVGILIAPVVLIDEFKEYYSNFLTVLKEKLSSDVKKKAQIEIIFMTYSYVHNAINTQAFPKAVNLYDKSMMTGRGRGKYTYRDFVREDAENFLREQIKEKLPEMKILYIV